MKLPQFQDSGELNKPKIILFDIESTHLKADLGFMLTFGYKELGGQTKVISIRDFPRFEKDCTDDTDVITEAYKVVSNADVVVSYFGKGFDWPFLQTRLMFLKNRIYLPKVPHVDLYFTAKHKLRVHSNRLANLQQAFECKVEKTPVAPRIWLRAMSGHIPSIKYVEDHNEKDVDVLEEVYEILKPMVDTHPNLTAFRQGEPGFHCRRCLGKRLQSRGLRINQKRLLRQFWCKDCGTWTLYTERELETAVGTNAGLVF